MESFRLLLRNPDRWARVDLGITLETGIRYFVVAGIAWMLAHVLFRRRWQHRKIIGRPAPSADVRREVFYSSLTILIFGLVGTATFIANARGWGRIYWHADERGWPWFWASIAVAIVIHDTYFYWTHRLMHHRWLYPWFHRVHHQSTNPTPWAAYAFAPLEALVEAGIFPVVSLAIPSHPLAFGIFMLWQIVFNVLGHTGYEFHPRWLLDSKVGRWLNTPTNHILHHEKFRGNYGLYFNFWDRILGTNHPDYESRFREVTGRPAPSDRRHEGPAHR